MPRAAAARLMRLRQTWSNLIRQAGHRSRLVLKMTKFSNCLKLFFLELESESHQVWDLTALGRGTRSEPHNLWIVLKKRPDIAKTKCVKQWLLTNKLLDVVVTLVNDYRHLARIEKKNMTAQNTSDVLSQIFSFLTAASWRSFSFSIKVSQKYKTAKSGSPKKEVR